MINSQRIFKNSFFITTGLLVDGFILFLVGVLSARYLGVETFGYFVLILTIVNLFQILANGGMVNITIREIARTKEQTQNILSATLTLAMLILSSLFLLIHISILIFQPDIHLKITIYLLGLSALITIHAAIQAAVLRAYEDMGRVAITALLQKITLLLSVLIAIYFDWGIEGIAYAYFIGSLINWLAYFLWVRIFYVQIIWLIDPKYWRFLIKEAIPLGVSMLLRRITIHTDTFLLAIFSTAIAVGLFNSAYQPIQMLEGAILALSGVLFPVFSRLAKESMLDFQKLFSKSLKIFIILSTPLAIWLLILSQELITLIYGVEYREAGKILAILGLTLFFLMPGALFFAVFSALNRQTLFLLLTIIGFIINVSLDIALIPIYDYLGAAIATFITEATVFIIGAFLLYRLKIKANYFSIYSKSLLAIFLPSILLLICLQSNNYWLITLGSCLYLIIYLWIAILIKLIHKNELSLFKNLLNRKTSKSQAIK